MIILSRTEMIFCSKNIPKSYAIFLLRKVVAYFSEVIFREENEYFSFMKNIPWVIFGVFQRKKVELVVDGSLG